MSTSDAQFCTGCGSATCRGCLPEFDPPRFCAVCGGWLAVAVRTSGWVARCRSCDSTVRGE